jgi:DNA-binding XRE family transcriptional regulator
MAIHQFMLSAFQIIRSADYIPVLRQWEHGLRSIRSLAHRGLVSVLREARKQGGLTQQEVAKRLRRPQSFVSAYESGDRRIDVLEFLRIARALGADPCVLLKRIM